MRRFTRLLVILSIGTFPICGYTQAEAPKFVALLHAPVISQSVGEVVELLVAAPDLPLGLSDGPATVTYRFELGGDSCGNNIAKAEATTGRFARFAIEIDSAGNLSVNGTSLCYVAEEDGRVTYQFSVQRGVTAKFLSGGEFPIPVGYERGRTITISYFGAASHETHDVDIVPIAILDTRTAADPYSY